MYNRDQRKHPRITYKCSLTLWERGGFATIFANTVNISAGGLLVNLDRGLMVGAKVDIKIDFQNNIDFECCGRVLRCKQYSKNEEYPHDFFAVAISLEDLNESQKLIIKNVIDKLFSQQNVM